MKKILLLFLLNFLISNELTFNSKKSFIKYTGYHPLHSWEGFSKDIEFRLNQNNNTFSIYISTRLDSFNSNNENRDSNMLFYTESLKFPKVTFISENIEYKNLENLNLIKGTLYFHGVEKSIIAKVKIIEKQSTILGECNFQIKLSDFNIERPKLLMLSIKDNIDLKATIELLK